MRKFLCFIGAHTWAHPADDERSCKHCKRREKAFIDYARMDIVWKRIN